MNDFQPTKWAKKNKITIVSQYLKKQQATREERATAIFMAGLPGSGKTEFSKNLVKNARLNVFRIDMDEIATKMKNYTPENADSFRAGATIILERLFDTILKNRYSFIMDGTLGGKKAVKNIERSLKNGYIVNIIWIIQNPKEAWHFTKEREKIEHRAISKEGFIDSYYNILYNIKTIQEKYGDKINIDIVTKELKKIQNWKTNIANSEVNSILENKLKIEKEEIEKYVN